MNEKSIVSHILDVKKITLRLCIFFALIFAVIIWQAERVFFEFLPPLKENAKLVFTSVESGFTTRMEIAFNLSVVLFLPILLFEILLYLKSAFKIKFGLFFSSFILYFIAIFTTIKFALPFCANFLISMGFLGVEFYIDASKFILFSSKMLFAFAFILETPIALILLINTGVLSKTFLKKQRKVVFVLSFVLGAILTPPDVLSQIFCAFLLYSLFELAILTSKNKTS